MTMNDVSEPGRPALDGELQERIHRLWDKVAAFEAARIEAALTYLLKSVAELIDAQNAYSMGAVRWVEDERDPLGEWRPSLIHCLQPLPNERFTKQITRLIQNGEVDESTVAYERLAGTFRSCLLRNLVSPEWFNGETYQSYLDEGVYDLLVVGVPVNSMSEAYYGFLRMRKSDPFTEVDRRVAFYAMRGLTWFHRQVLLAHGLIDGRAPLSPRERRVLSLLLTDQPEKIIAANLGLTPATLHTYVRDVFRKLGVNGRNGLIALWLGQQS